MNKNHMRAPKTSELRFSKAKLAKVPTSYWSQQTQNLFASITQIPWIGFTGIFTIPGATLLFFYFHSIGQPITDFQALFGLSVVTTLCGLGILALIALILASPLLAFVPYETRKRWVDDAVPFSFMERLSASLFLLSAFWLSYETQRFLDSSEQLEILHFLMLFLSGLTGILLLKKALVPKRPGHKLQRLGTVCFFGAMSFIPLLTLHGMSSWFENSNINGELIAVILGIGVPVFTANPKLMKEGLLAAFVFLMLAVVIVVLIPLNLGQADKIPALVAKAVGIRSDVVKTLGVPKATCIQLKNAALDAGVPAPNAQCDQDNWNRIEAKILSNMGSDWLLEFQCNPHSNGTGNTIIFRISVPAAGIQQSTLLSKAEPAQPSVQKTVSCNTPNAKGA